MSPHDVKVGGLGPDTSHYSISAPQSSRPSSIPSIANLINSTMLTPVAATNSGPPSLLPRKNKPAPDDVMTGPPAKRSKPSSPADQSPPESKLKRNSSKSFAPQIGASNNKVAELQQLKTAISISSGTSSPKPIVQRRAASPPRPQGNGLLSSASFGIQGGIANPSFEIPTIVLDIPLNLTGSNTFNIQRMAEEKYGWAALNPKVAYRQVQEKLAAAAGKSAKRNSGDDMDLDDSDGDEDNDPSTDDATSSLVDKPKRRRAIEEYDMRDPFIDDEEQIWEEQQKATKEGFFVFSGPLLADDGPKENEKADGAQPKKRAPAKSGTRARTSGAMAGKATRPRMSDADTGTDQKPGKRKRRTRAEMEAARAAGKVGPVKRVNKPLPTLAARPESTIVNSDY